MMVSTISRPMPTLAPAAAKKSVAADAPPATDPMDFTSIDTAAKAAMLPAFNPCSYMTFAGVLTASAMSGYPLKGDLAATIGNGSAQVALSAKYNLTTPGPGTLGIESTGQLGDARFHEVWSYGTDEAIRIAGSIEGSKGTVSENLVMQTGPNGGKLEGKIGNLDVHMLFTPNSFDGTIGGVPVHETLQATTGSGTMKFDVKGTVGTDAATYSASMSPTDPHGALIQGSGSVGAYTCTTSQTYQPQAPTRH